MIKIALVLALAAGSSAHAANPVRAVFDKIAAAKQDRVFHADGTAFRATVTDAKGATHVAVVRVSRAGADTKTHPDILGLAIKVKDSDAKGGEQDLLMVSSLGQRGIGARVPAFHGSFAGRTMSSLTSFKMGDQKGALTAKLPATFTTPVDDSPARPTGDQSFSVNMQSKKLFHAAVSTPVLENVTVHFDQPLGAVESKALRFTPYHEAGGIKPVGIVNAIRKAAYQGSQAGRGDPQ